MKTLMIMAGGTGGHVMPAIAVADALMAKGWKIVWLATEGGMENRLITGKRYAVEIIRMSGVRGKGLLRWFKLPLQLVRACLQSTQALRAHRPDVVLGMGGFAAFPGGLMSRLFGYPLVVHEQNSVAGLTNRVLSLFSNRVLAAFPSAFGKKATVVGNPVRPDIAAIPRPLERFSTRGGRLRLLVLGGSLGAQALNEIVPQALALLPETHRPRVIHQAGEKHMEALTENYRTVGVEVEARAFIENMADMYAWCDLVICRAGALTVAELSAAGVASILVPFPHAVDDHQTGNARYLSDAGAALLIQQRNLQPSELANTLSEMTREKLLDMAKKAYLLGKPEATEAVATICRELAE